MRRCVEALDRARQLGRALQGRPRTEPVHRALPSALRHHQKGVKPRFLVRLDPCRQQAPQTAVGAGAHPRNVPFEHARPRQQHLMRHQPCGRLVEQNTRPIRPRPAQRIKPAQKPPLRAWIGELAIAIGLPDFRRVLPACFSITIAHKAARVGDADPLCQGGGNLRRYLGRVGEEGAEKSHRAELYGEAETHVVPPAATDHRQVGVIEMEIAIKLFQRRGAVEAAVSLLLLDGQKTDRHLMITIPSRSRSNRRGQAYR